MYARQRGEISLWWLALLMAGFAAITMGALFSMRYERNLFVEGVSWLLKSSGGAVPQAQQAGAPGAGVMRKCVIDGKSVVSNVDCGERNPTSKTIAIHDTRGIEAPKAPAPAEPEAAAPTLRDKMIEKASR